jgi:hypothetical protein
MLTADRPHAPATIRIDLGAIFVSMETLMFLCKRWGHDSSIQPIMAGHWNGVANAQCGRQDPKTTVCKLFIRGLDTAFPYVRLGLLLSSAGHRHSRPLSSIEVPRPGPTSYIAHWHMIGLCSF